MNVAVALKPQIWGETQKLYGTLAVLTLLQGSDTCTLEEGDKIKHHSSRVEIFLEQDRPFTYIGL